MAHADPIPEDILEEALSWAVVLGDVDVTDSDRAAFEQWLQQGVQQQTAWQRLQVVEQEMAAARPAAAAASVLQQVSGRRERGRKRRSAIGGVLGLVLLAGLLLSYLQYWRYDYVTANAELQQITLEGGAQVFLDAGSALDISNGADGTILHLQRGRILVDTAGADARHKPRVETRHGRFRPVGTRFVVQDKATAVTLFVARGAVQITAGVHQKAAQAGQHWTVTADGQNDTVRQIDNMGLAADAWLDALIDADNARLGDVLDALTARHQGLLSYSDEVANMRVSGVFRLDNTDAALQSLQHSLPIRVRYYGPWWVQIDTVP